MAHLLSQRRCLALPLFHRVSECHFYQAAFDQTRGLKLFLVMVITLAINKTGFVHTKHQYTVVYYWYILIIQKHWYTSGSVTTCLQLQFYLESTRLLQFYLWYILLILTLEHGFVMLCLKMWPLPEPLPPFMARFMKNQDSVLDGMIYPKNSNCF